MSKFTEISITAFGDRIFYKDELGNLWRNEKLTIPTSIVLLGVPYNEYPIEQKEFFLAVLNGEIEL